MTVSKHELVARVYTPGDPIVFYSEGFELNTGGFTGVSVDGRTTTVSRVPTSAHTGTYSLSVSISGSSLIGGGWPGNKAVRTITGLTIGTRYTFSGWSFVAGSPKSPYNDFRLGVTGVGQSAWAAIQTSNTWKQLSYSFKASSTSHELFLEKGTTNSTYVRWDDLQLAEANPESTYVDLPVIDGDIEMDLGWSPYIQGSIFVPYSDAVAALDPRQSPPPRIYITATQTFGNSWSAARVSNIFTSATVASTVSGLYANAKASSLSNIYMQEWNEEPQNTTSKNFNLTVRGLTVDHASKTAQIKLTSDESLLQDYGLVRTQPWVLQSQSVRTIASMVLNSLGFSLSAGTADGTIEDVSASWEPGQTAWDFLQPLVQTAGLRLWSDEHRLWHLGVDEPAATGHVELASDQTVTSAESEVSRDSEWYDAVVIKYEWDNILGDQQVRYDIASVANPTKVLSLTYEQAWPGNGAAANILKRKQQLGETLPVVAVSSYDVEPGMTFNVSVVGQPTRTGTIQSVKWSWPADEMSITAKNITTI